MLVPVVSILRIQYNSQVSIERESVSKLLIHFYEEVDFENDEKWRGTQYIQGRLSFLYWLFLSSSFQDLVIFWSDICSFFY